MEYSAVMSGAGNTFVVVDNRDGSVRNITAFTKKICGIKKLDGGLFIGRSDSAAFRMKIINADGSEPDMCGNGSRCAALFALDRRIVKTHSFTIETGAGKIGAEIGKNGMVKVRLTEPKDFRQRIRLDVKGLPQEICFVNTGVPHAVIIIKDIRSLDVHGLGKIVRNHGYFRPEGTNVNFVSVKNPHEIAVRTYERGVEDETKACGTGSTASALITAWLGLTKVPTVHVDTTGGDVLWIHFDRVLRNVSLEGQVNYLQV